MFQIIVTEITQDTTVERLRQTVDNLELLELTNLLNRKPRKPRADRGAKREAK